MALFSNLFWYLVPFHSLLFLPLFPFEKVMSLAPNLTIKNYAEGVWVLPILKSTPNLRTRKIFIFVEFAVAHGGLIILLPSYFQRKVT
jgi:hypothetical protein